MVVSSQTPVWSALRKLTEGLSLWPHLYCGPFPDPPVEVFHNSGELGLLRHHLWESRMTQLEGSGGAVASC